LRPISAKHPARFRKNPPLGSRKTTRSGSVHFVWTTVGRPVHRHCSSGAGTTQKTRAAWRMAEKTERVKENARRLLPTTHGHLLWNLRGQAHRVRTLRLPDSNVTDSLKMVNENSLLTPGFFDPIFASVIKSSGQHSFCAGGPEGQSCYSTITSPHLFPSASFVAGGLFAACVHADTWRPLFHWKKGVSIGGRCFAKATTRKTPVSNEIGME
jgi:hypothetical protein